MSESKKITRSDLWKSYFYSLGIESGCSTTKQEAPGFAQGLIPIIEKIYPNKEERAEAYSRHMELFLTEGRVAYYCVGVAAAMEERNAMEKDVDPESINAIKVALMGPLAALGDSIIHGTIRPIMAGLACSMIATSNYTSPVGTFIFLGVMTTVVMVSRYFGIFKGYDTGLMLVSSMQAGGILDRLTKYAAIAAFIVCGGFISSLVWSYTPIEYVSGDTVIALQDVLDGLMPQLVPLLYTLLMYYLINKKKINPVLLIVATMVLCCVLVYFNILA
ncbi:MAG: PTS system mannose/fructose/sorbose family transporter subunit IID [Erysipelotrichaceae bacterium]|jgi:mannose/fructose/N-acetylgalactosamine-specific phosphotransferase system component IID|nr:PTS system mannose/fructose/sorbose family transporter subunit IID [Erysipelotrichaceae bacterium]